MGHSGDQKSFRMKVDPRDPASGTHGGKEETSQNTWEDGRAPGTDVRNVRNPPIFLGGYKSYKL